MRLNKYFLVGILLYCLIYFCNTVSHEERKQVDNEMIEGAWWLQSMTVRAEKNGELVNIDSTYEYSNSTQLINIFTDYLVFYTQIKTSDCDSIPTYRTISSEKYYKIEIDTIYIWSESYEMRAKIELKSDTLIETIIIDKYNPYIMLYGTGKIVNKYLRHIGEILPPEWPPLCP